MLSLPGAAAATGVVRPEACPSQPWPGWPTTSSWWAMTTRRQVGVAARRAPRCLASSPLPSLLPGPGPPPASGREPREEETPHAPRRWRGRPRPAGLCGPTGRGRGRRPFAGRSGPGERRGRTPGRASAGGKAAAALPTWPSPALRRASRPRPAGGCGGSFGKARNVRGGPAEPRAPSRRAGGAGLPGSLRGCGSNCC